MDQNGDLTATKVSRRGLAMKHGPQCGSKCRGHGVLQTNREILAIRSGSLGGRFSLSLAVFVDSNCISSGSLRTLLGSGCILQIVSVLGNTHIHSAVLCLDTIAEYFVLRT